MSLIHEALQKAEAERRVGELPPLVSVTATPRRTTSSLAKPFWAMVGLAVLVAAIYTNRALILPATEMPQADDSAATTSEESSTTPERPDAHDVRAAEAPRVARKPEALRQPQPAAPVMDAFAAAQTDAIAAHLGAGRGTAPELQLSPEAVEAPTDAALTPPPKPAPTPVLPEEPTVAAPAKSEPPSTTPAPLAETKPDVPVSAVATTEAPMAAPANAPSAQPSSPTPMIFELPLATRQALPALKVTMQVYHQDPSRRFAIIDGKRVGENGVVGNELNLIEVQRDAMLLEFRGTRFLLPRLGR